MSKSYRSLLATTVIAGFAVAAVPAYAQDASPAPPAGTTDTTAPGGATTEGQTQAGTTADTSSGAQPQEAVPPAQGQGGEIIVTGTLIRNPNLTSSSPVAVVGQEEINLRQATNAEQILRTIPGVSPGLGQNVNNGNNGTATVDLRGLGQKRNLVLLDSTRLVPANTGGAVDLNNIPLALIDRIDVLTGGASTTYGADAVTGVVNFITKKNFAGVDLRLNENETERGDGNILRADLTLGANFDDGRGNAVLSIGYIESDPVSFGDRPFGECVITSATGECGGSSSTAVPASVAFPKTDLNGATGKRQVDPTSSVFVPSYSTFNFNPYNVYQTPFQRYNAFGQAHYDVSDAISVYGRAMYTKTTNSGVIAPSGLFGTRLTIPGNNPFLTDAEALFICQHQFITVPGPDGKPVNVGTPINDLATCRQQGALVLPAMYRRTPEVGPRIDQFQTNIFDFKAGATWNINSHMSFDLYGAYGESETVQRRQNYVGRTLVQAALNADNPNTCTNALLPNFTAPAGCVPINLFGQLGSITPEMAGFVGGVESTISRGATLAQVHGVLSGDFGGFTLPWANKPISFAIGGEHRDYTAHTRPDALAQQPGELGGAGGAILKVEGGYTAEDGFGELIVPIASDRPFFDELTVEAGLRRSHYVVDAAGKPKFSATTYKVGGTWAPFDAVKFRGNYQQAVRAPNIAELFTPVVTGLTNLGTDPCAGTANPAEVTTDLPLNPNLTSAALQAICIAQGGIPGSIPKPISGQVNLTVGGNPFLKPETAHTWTVGVVLNPHQWLPGFNATLDYYNIKIKNGIVVPVPGDMIRACFGDNPANPPAGAATSAPCLTIIRNPALGGLSGDPSTTPGLFAATTNNGRLKTDGFDFTANYRRNVGFADLILNFAGNYTRDSRLQSIPVLGFGPNCAGVYSANCGITLGQLQPKWAWSQRTTLSFKPVDISLLWRHIGKFHYENGAPNNLTPLCGPGNPGGDTTCDGTIQGGPLTGKTFNANRIPAFNYFDLTTRFSITDHYELTLSAFNIFDKKPPLIGGEAGTTFADSGNTFPSTYDALGRKYSATLRLKF